MKLNMKRAVLTLALAGVFSTAQAATVNLNDASFPYELGTNPTDANAYSVTHAVGSFSDVYTFDLTQLSNTISSAVSIDLPGFNGGPASYNISGGTLSLFSDPGDDGAAGVNTLIGSTTFGSTDGILTANNVAAGDYFWAVAGNADGTQGGLYLFAANTTAIPEPETYALMLAGLGLLGFIVKRKLGEMPLMGSFGMA